MVPVNMAPPTAELHELQVSDGEDALFPLEPDGRLGCTREGGWVAYMVHRQHIYIVHDT